MQEWTRPPGWFRHAANRHGALAAPRVVSLPSSSLEPGISSEGLAPRLLLPAATSRGETSKVFAISPFLGTGGNGLQS